MWVNLTINNVRKEERKKSFTVIEIKRSLFWGLLWIWSVSREKVAKASSWMERNNL